MLKTQTQFKEPKGLLIDGSQSVAPVCECEQLVSLSVFLIENYELSTKNRDIITK